MAGEAAVERLAAGEAGGGFRGGGEDGADVVGGAEALEHAAVEEGFEGGFEEEDDGAGGLFEEELVGELLGGAAAEGEDGVGEAEGVGEGGGFEVAEVGFAVGGEECGDRGAGACFEVVVEVEKLPAEGLREQTAGGGFAGTHETGEDDAVEGGGQGDGGGLDRHGGVGG